MTADGWKRSGGQACLRVLESFPGRGASTNPYLLQLVDSLPDTVSVRYFSWRAALTEPFDVFHVHWPERLVRGSSRLTTIGRRLAFIAFLLRLSARGTAVVRTVHNPDTHERGGLLERRLLAALDRRTTLWIRLNPFTELPDGAVERLIVHGHYRDWFRSHARPTPPRGGRVLFFGLVRRYKGVEELLEAFRALPDGGASLRLVGKAQDEALRRSLSSSASQDPRVSAAWEYADDAVLAEEVRSAQLVVLPYRSVHNSGAALLALSLGRPVLMPANEVTRWLQSEVGERWLLTYESPLDADALERALQQTALPWEPGAPEFRGRDWAESGILHAEAFEAAVQRMTAPARKRRRVRSVSAAR